jgi:hypothetical protein
MSLQHIPFRSVAQKYYLVRYPIQESQNKGFPAKIRSSIVIPDVPVQKGTWKENDRGKRMEWK